MSESVIVPALEWEPVSVEGSWNFKLPEGSPIGQGFNALALSRDLDWRLKATASSESYVKPVERPQDLRLGQMTPPISEVTATRFDASLVLSGAYLVNWSYSTGRGSRVDVIASRARIVLGDPKTASSEAKTCVVWCLNGPERDFPFSMVTRRKRVSRYERNRDGFPDRVYEYESEEGSRDAVMLPPPVCGVAPAVLAIIPKGVPIEYELRPAAVEFLLPAAAQAAAWEEIESYLAAVSFVVGRRLIPVGFTILDERSRPRRHELCSAWSIDLRAECRRPAAPPVRVDHGALNYLIPRFVERANELGLINAMWLVWLAQAQPLEAALPHLAAALECMVTAWFKSTKTKSRGKYMEDADWTSVSEEAMKLLHNALKGWPYADRIVRRAQGANNRGVNERFEHFFEELDLPVGEVELRAIHARNKAAHGGSFSPSQYQALADNISAYRSLVYRVMLALLEWKGEYIDYSTYGFPSRQLKDRLGGPAGDGKPAIL